MILPIGPKEFQSASSPGQKASIGPSAYVGYMPRDSASEAAVHRLHMPAVTSPASDMRVVSPMKSEISREARRISVTHPYDTCAAYKVKLMYGRAGRERGPRLVILAGI